jgi:hypothetical protein
MTPTLSPQQWRPICNRTFVPSRLTLRRRMGAFMTRFRGRSCIAACQLVSEFRECASGFLLLVGRDAFQVEPAQQNFQRLTQIDDGVTHVAERAQLDDEGWRLAVVSHGCCT